MKSLLTLISLFGTCNMMCNFERVLIGVFDNDLHNITDLCSSLISVIAL